MSVQLLCLEEQCKTGRWSVRKLEQSNCFTTLSFNLAKVRTLMHIFGIRNKPPILMPKPSPELDSAPKV